LIREKDHLANCVGYIWRNPDKAHLRDGESTRFEREFATEMTKEEGRPRPVSVR